MDENRVSRRLASQSVNYKLTFSGCPFGTTCIYEGNLEFKVQMDEEGPFYDPEGKNSPGAQEAAVSVLQQAKWTSGRTRFDWKLDDATGSVAQKGVADST